MPHPVWQQNLLSRTRFSGLLGGAQDPVRDGGDQCCPLAATILRQHQLELQQQMVQISPYLRRFFEQFAMGFASTPKSAIFACDLEPSQNLRALANPSQNFRGQFRENFASSHKGSRLHHSQICEGLQIYFLQKLEKPFGVAFFATTHKTSLEPWQICEHSQTFSHNWSHLQVSRFGNFGQGERNIFLWEITHKEIYSASVFTLQEVISLSREKYSQE